MPARTFDVTPLVPARMLNEFAYCPRLAYLEWVQRDFCDSADTVDGRTQHRRVDVASGALSEPDVAPEPEMRARAVELSAPILGMVAKIDLLETDAGDMVPVDYKRGDPPDTPEGAWEPERVQLCAQGLILEENGYRCSYGELYFVRARQRVRIEFDDALRARTRELLAGLRRSAESGTIPPPLVASPKCPRCSLVSICLPDEVNFLTRAPVAEAPTPRSPPRRLVPSHDDAFPVYVQATGARVGRDGEELVVTETGGEKHRRRLLDVSQLVVFGNVQVSTQLLRELAARDVPVLYLSTGGWFSAMTVGMGHKNIDLRRDQHAHAASPVRSLALATRFVSAKIKNCRTLLRRNAEDVPKRDLDRLRELGQDALEAPSVESLLGTEGTAARLYFQNFPRMIKGDVDTSLSFEGRSRRPPTDPINAILSFLYAILVKDVVTTLMAVGLDPYLGFLHQPRYGRPALALDLMEEFRPIICDSIAITVLNTGVLGPSDFLRRSVGISLRPAGRSRVLEAYERRLDDLVAHPIFGYRVVYRRILEVQARLLARVVSGEIAEYPGFVTR
jgi:CRISP-associated protein Cas1